MNPDARLAPGAIEALENAAARLPNFVAANPLILDAKGRGRIKTTSALPLTKVPTPHLDQDSALAVLSGAAFFVSTQAFHAVGGFDPAIFLYHEDHDLAVRLVENGGGLWHVAGATVTHVAGTGSARTSQTAAFKGYHMARSRYYALSKHAPRGAFLRTMGPALLGLLAPFNLLSSRRRAKYTGQIHGAWSVRTDKGIYDPI